MAKWNEPYNNQDTFNITETSRVLNLDTRYHPESGDLLVFYNGVLARRNIDYKEINAYTIEFNYDLEAGDVVFCQLQKLW